MNLVKGISRLVLVVLCAVFLAAQPINGLVATSIKGVVGTEQDAQTKAQQWGWATQWSLPKLETLGLVVPGLFGYRMDTPDGGTYWGMIGRDPAWEKYLADDSQGPPPTGFLRYVGSGYYTGVLVVLVAFWAVAQSLRRKDSRFNIEHRKWLWFWLGVAVFSLLLALGRFAPFYRWFYALPYASTIRNPDKVLYLFSLAVVVLFAFGVDGLWRKYMQPSGTNADSRWLGLQSWWNRATKFDKYWVYGCGLVGVASLLAWLDYSQHRHELEQYLLSVQFDASDADSIASFSIHQVGWFILFFSLAAGIMVLIISGAFAGKRAGRGIVLLGLLLLADLGLANRPWIFYWNYKEKYASNPVIDLLRDKPYEHRVALAFVNLPPALMTISYLYKDEWLQQQFPFYNIQSFDVVEMSRLPEDMSALMKVLNQTNVTDPAFLWSRVWQLTNTRYILGPADFWNFWDQQRRLAQTPLQTVVGFDIVPKPGISEAAEWDQLTAVPNNDGPFALFEFKAALPRAKLYDHWRINTNDPDVLKQLFSPGFNPESSVFVAGGVPANSATDGTNQTAGVVQFASYAPKDITLKTDVVAPSVLLLNDHYDPNWKVLVDGRPKTLLRCNFVMRGVYLLPGTHVVEFKFQPPVGLFYVSLSAIAMGLLAIGILVVSANKNRLLAPNLASPPPPPAAPHPQTNPRASGTFAKGRPMSQTESMEWQEVQLRKFPNPIWRMNSMIASKVMAQVFAVAWFALIGSIRSKFIRL
jgi:hypothetical protein